MQQEWTDAHDKLQQELDNTNNQLAGEQSWVGSSAAAARDLQEEQEHNVKTGSKLAEATRLCIDCRPNSLRPWPAGPAGPAGPWLSRSQTIGPEALDQNTSSPGLTHLYTTRGSTLSDQNSKSMRSCTLPRRTDLTMPSINDPKVVVFGAVRTIESFFKFERPFRRKALPSLQGLNLSALNSLVLDEIKSSELSSGQ